MTVDGLLFVNVTYLIRQFLNGMVTASMLALMALGFSLSWGVMRVMNFAHGAFFMIGAYMAFLFYHHLGVGLMGSFLLAVALTVPVGAAVQHLLIRPLMESSDDDDEVEMRIIAALIGVWISLEMGVQIVLGSEHRTFPPFLEGAMTIAGVSIARHRIFLIAASAVLLGAFFASLKYTRLGMALRAVAQDSDTAELMGIHTRRVHMLTFGVSIALAAAAGILLAPIYGVYPSVGTRPFLLAFIVVIIGGLGSLKGPIYAAILIGLTQSLLTVWVNTEWVDVIVFALMIVVLTVRPSGISGVVEA